MQGDLLYDHAPDVEPLKTFMEGALKEHNELNHEESFLLDIVQNTLKYYAFADDVLHQIGRLQVLNFFELEENGTPLSAPSVNIDCLEQGICKNTAGKCWTTESRQKYLTLFDAKAQQLLVKTAKTT